MFHLAEDRFDNLFPLGIAGAALRGSQLVSHPLLDARVGGGLVAAVIRRRGVVLFAAGGDMRIDRQRFQLADRLLAEVTAVSQPENPGRPVRQSVFAWHSRRGLPGFSVCEPSALENLAPPMRANITGRQKNRHHFPVDWVRTAFPLRNVAHLGDREKLRHLLFVPGPLSVVRCLSR